MRSNLMIWFLLTVPYLPVPGNVLIWMKLEHMPCSTMPIPTSQLNIADGEPPCKAAHL